jgi:hypothetical protein
MFRKTALALCVIIFIANIAKGAESIANGSTNVSIYVVLEASNGNPNASIPIADLDLYYQEYQATQASKADATALAAADSAHADNKAYHCGNALYRIDFPDAAFDGGVGKQVTCIVDDGSGTNRTAYITVMLSPQVDAYSISGDSVTADNLQTAKEEMLIVYDTDWATNYDTTNNMWNVDMEKANGNDIPCTTAQLVSDAVDLSQGTTLQVDASGYALLSDGTGVGQIDLTSGRVELATLDEDDVTIDLDSTTVNAVAVTTTEEIVNTTTIAALTSQTSFTLTAGSTDDDAYNGCTIIIKDSATTTQKAVGVVKDYTGSTKTVTLWYDPGIFTMAATDNVYIQSNVFKWLLDEIAGMIGV